MAYVPGCCHIMKKICFILMLQKTWCNILGAHCVWTFRCSHFAQKCCLGMQICWFWDRCWLVWGSPLLMKSFFCSLFSVSLPTQVHRCFSAFSSVSMETSPKLWALICSQCFLFLAVFSTTCHSYKPVLESWKGFYSLESLFPLFFSFFWIASASSKIAKNSYCVWL